MKCFPKMEEKGYPADLGEKKGLYKYIFPPENNIQTGREKHMHIHCVLSVVVNSCYRTSVTDCQVPISQIMFFRKHFQGNWPMIIALRGK